MLPRVLLFVGQGSLRGSSCGADLLRAFPNTAKPMLEIADKLAGYSFSSLLSGLPVSPGSSLRLTQFAQPAIFFTQALTMAAIDENIKNKLNITASIGHSLGEYAALHACGSLSFPSALSLTLSRGSSMASAAQRRPGAMAALVRERSEDEHEWIKQVSALCDRISSSGVGVVSVSNINSVRQLSVSGEAAAIEKIKQEIQQQNKGTDKAAGRHSLGRFIDLRVSEAFHCSLMSSAVPAFARALADVAFSAPAHALVSNQTARPVKDIKQMPEYLLAQFTSPVLFSQSIDYLLSSLSGPIEFLEFGPSSVLAPLVAQNAKRMGREKQMKFTSLCTAEHVQAFIEQENRNAH